MKQIFNFYTDKGNVSVKTRAEIKNQVNAYLKGAMPNLEMSDKGLRIPLVTNERGETVYAFIAVTISANTEVKEKAAKEKAVDTITIPSIFGE